jgi:retron-type reverse transcriptase
MIKIYDTDKLSLILKQLVLSHFEKLGSAIFILRIMENYKIQILEKLKSGKSSQDFIEAYNILISHQNSLDGKKRKLIDEKIFIYLYRNLNRQYIQFTIPKKSGEKREISAPKKQLKYLQKNLSLIISWYYKPNIHCHGFIQGRSIVTNAEIHTNKNFVLNVDLKDFFPSIRTIKVSNYLQRSPFEFSEPLAKIIARIASKEGVLPQGSPLSPILSNICCETMDIDLAKLSERFKLTYSRYADDLTFSGYRSIFDSLFFTELGKIVRRKHNFQIKKSKTRIQTKNKRQEVTGVVVNEKLNVNRTYVRNLRAMINYHKVGKAEKNAVAVIKGKLEFLKMIKGKDRVYRNLLSQYKSTSHE